MSTRQSVYSNLIAGAASLNVVILFERRNICASGTSDVHFCLIFAVKIEHILRFELKCQCIGTDKPDLLVRSKEELQHLPLLHQLHHHRHRHTVVRSQRGIFSSHPPLFNIGFYLRCPAHADHIIVCLQTKSGCSFVSVDILRLIHLHLIPSLLYKRYQKVTQPISLFRTMRYLCNRFKILNNF